MITTRHYQLDIRDCDWNIAHIYEHLLINKSHAVFFKHGINPDLFGWISGETFEEQLFLDAGFYEEKTAFLFDEFISVPHVFSEQEVRHSIATVEQEERAHTNISATEIQSSLHKLRTKQWNTLLEHPPKNTPKDVVLKKAAKDFRDITIGIAAMHLSPNEEKVFLRCRPILSDIIFTHINSLMPAYQRGTSPAIKCEHNSKFFMIFTINKASGRMLELEASLKKHLNTYPVAPNWEAFRAHFDGFASEELWRDSAVEYFRNTGIVTTPDEINHLATRPTIEKIFANLHIRIRTTTPDDRHAVFD